MIFWLVLAVCIGIMIVSYWPRKKTRQVLTRKIREERAAPVPEVQMLKTYSVAQGCPWRNVLSMGDIYRAGVYPRYRPNTPLALECYRTASMAPDPKIAGLARAKIVDVLLNPPDVTQNQGHHLPANYGRLACQMARTRHYVTITRPPPPPPPARHYHGDAQNVHDHAVIRTVYNNLKAMKAHEPNAVERVRDCILNLDALTADDKTKALMTLDDLNDTNEHSTFGLTETEALGKTWAKIQDTKDLGTRGNLEEMLGRQLASAVENGHVVCSTGKISRIVDTFQGVTDDVERTRPLSAVSEELGTLAAKVREDCLQKSGPLERQRYEAGEHPELETRMKDEFRKMATKTYVSELGMQSDVLSPLLESFLGAF